MQQEENHLVPAITQVVMAKFNISGEGKPYLAILVLIDGGRRFPPSRIMR